MPLTAHEGRNESNYLLHPVCVTYDTNCQTFYGEGLGR